MLAANRTEPASSTKLNFCSLDYTSSACGEVVNLKSEFLDYYGYKLPIKLMKKVVDENIKVYNQDRPHLSCYMKTPNQMHIKIRTYKSKNPQQEVSCCGFN